jgi:phosphate transport system protein
MAREDFDRDLRQLKDDLLLMGNMVEKAIANSIDGLKRRDLNIAQEVISGDDYIDQKRYEIEDRCINLIATQQPMAGDLRTLVSMLQISVELERMGDYAEGIAKISLSMGSEPTLKPLIDIPRMAEKASDMVRRSLDSLVNRDVITATSLAGDDDEVDDLYKQVYEELIAFMTDDPKTIIRATYLLWVAHDLERIADRATNIGEQVIYLVTGKR